MRESSVASVGKRPAQGPGSGARAPTPASSGPEGALSYGQQGGNQAFLSLLGRSVVQRKLRVGAANDRFEHEADRAADAVVRATYAGDRARSRTARAAPTLHGILAPGSAIVQRKCAKCEEEEEEVTIRRSPRGSTVGLSDSTAEDPTPASAPTAEPTSSLTSDSIGQEPPSPSPEGETSAATPAPTLLVDDETESVGADQMKKTAFLDALRPAVCAAVDQGLAGTGRNSNGCPHVEYWFAHLAGKDAAFIERGIQRFAPGARGVRSAADYIPAVAERVQQSTELWALTGEIAGVPEEFAQAVAAGGTPPETGGASAAAAVRFKARAGGARAPDSPAAVRDELGPGQPLEGGVRARMESAYGTRFSHVRMHTDATGARLSDRLNARAFAVGQHVAFGAGEYRPGTLLGDALIAHELAHVVQQHGAAGTVAPMEPSGASTRSLEAEADLGAMSAVARLWGAARDALGGVGQHAIPRLRSGLRLSACRSKEPCTTRTTAPTPRKTITVRHSHLWGGGSAADFARHVTYADKVYDIAGIDVVAGTAETIGETDTKDSKLLGSDAKVEASSKSPVAMFYTSEEKALLAHNSSGGEMTAYYVKDLKNIGTSWALSYPDSNKVVLSARVSDDRVLAHEIGHVLVGFGHPTNNDNIMAQTKVATGVDCLSDDQISDARDHSLAK